MCATVIPEIMLWPLKVKKAKLITTLFSYAPWFSIELCGKSETARKLPFEMRKLPFEKKAGLFLLVRFCLFVCFIVFVFVFVC